jgi:hypothetical protein
MPRVRGYTPPQLSPLNVHPAQFMPTNESLDYDLFDNQLISGGTFDVHFFLAPIILPNGVTVTKLTLFGYRSDALSELSVYLYQNNRADVSMPMANVALPGTTGWQSASDDSIDYAKIDNVNYVYVAMVRLDPNDSVNDVRFTGITIEFAG